jgi:hypothetical protein
MRAVRSAQMEAAQAEERALVESLATPQAATTLIEDRGHPEFRLDSHYTVTPRIDRTMEQAVLRSLSRRAMRAVRPHIQSIPREELWGVLFDEGCLMVVSERLAMAVEGRRLVAPLSILGWAEAKGARALVLVQNRHGSRQTAAPLALGPTLKIAATAHLHGMVLVDHIIIHPHGAATHLRRCTALAEAQAFAIQHQTDLEDLAANHSNFALSTPSTTPTPRATLL